MKKIDIYVSEEKSEQVLAEIARFTYAISAACGSVKQTVKEV